MSVPMPIESIVSATAVRWGTHYRWRMMVVGRDSHLYTFCIYSHKEPNLLEINEWWKTCSGEAIDLTAERNQILP